MAGITLNVLGNFRDFIRGTQDTERALDDVADSLDDVGRDGQKSGDKLERSFRDLADAAKDTGRDIGKSTEDGFDRAKRGAQEFKDEANSTAREAAASFDGSAESAADAFQEVAANAFSGFGPAGAAAGLAAALGLGAAMSAITAQQEAVDELKQKFAEAYKEAAEDGRTFLDEAQIQAAALEILFDPEKRKSAQEEASRIGADSLDLVRAQAGDQDALNAIIDLTTQKEQERKDALVEANGVQGHRLAIADAEVNALEQIRAKYEEQLGIQKDNEQAARDAKELKSRAAEEERADIDRAKAADAARWQSFADNAARAKGAAAGPVVVPIVPDSSAFEAEVERIRRATYSATLDINWQHRGRQTP
jgi:hypothetical protein